jgi:hypothetical protein
MLIYERKNNMNEYKIEFYKNDEEIDISVLPDEYLNGVIQACRSELAYRERLERVFKRMVNKDL